MSIFVICLKPIKQFLYGLFFIFSINKDVIQIFNNKKVKFFY